ncbi:hypothetical protein F4823DRAFT_23894 [Ustulina deusta]|nr:hypothetical protein F4823DRAFT_23894 [Ustulina deusta]
MRPRVKRGCHFLLKELNKPHCINRHKEDDDSLPSKALFGSLGPAFRRTGYITTTKPLNPMVTIWKRSVHHQSLIAGVAIDLHEMASSAYKSEGLLAALRAATASNSAENCEVCQLQNKIVCDHLTAQQYASLKATKRTLATEGDAFRVFECGDVYHALRRISCIYRGPKEKTKGLCNECWRYIVSNGKRRRVDHVGKRRNQSNARYRSKVDDTGYVRLRGKYRIWSMRGPMIGRRQI